MRRTKRRRKSRKPRRQRILFGIELETVGRTRQELAQALNIEFGGFLQVKNVADDEEPEVKEDEAEYELQYSLQGKVRSWQVLDDDSLHSDKGAAYRSEVVSSALDDRDLPLVQRVCKTLLIAGAKTNETCGLHVHFSSDLMDGRSLRRLVALTYMYEPILYRALGVSETRMNKYCKPINEQFAKEILAADYDLMTIMKRWYDIVGKGAKEGRLDPVRFHGLNLNPDPVKHHFEFRYFNGTLDPDTVTSYVQFSLKLLRFSVTSRNFLELNDAMEFRSMILRDPSLQRREFARFLDRIGLGSRRYARTRALFLKNL